MDARTIALLVALALLVAPALMAADGYIGSAACAPCHRQVYDTYAKTAMGRAASPATAHLALAPEKVTVVSEKLQRTFEVFVEDGRLRQTESGANFRNTHPLDYALGSGVNGLSFLLRRGDHLFQAPLSYYSRARAWGLSPGYEFADYGFNRPIAAACIACHSGRPQPVPGRNGQFAEPPFQELSIGCENCHGPGQDHVRRGGARAAIVNPKRLPAARAEEICMNCHQGGDTRILQPGKTALDFRPGQVLADTVAIFKIPRAPNQTADVDLLEHHESMHLSQCYRQSAGKLNCITCHQPHAAKTDPRAACLGCHQTPPAAPHPDRASDCIACHMPKREIGFIAHSALTNHRIVRVPKQPLPITTEPSDLIHFNRVPGRPLPLLTRLQAYGELLERHPPYMERFQALLDEAGKKVPDDPLVLAALGRRALRTKDFPAAIDYLNKAAARGSESSTTFEDLGEALAQAGKMEEAIAALRRGIQLAPFTPVLYKSLALRYIRLNRYADAKQTLERYVELFPEDDFVRRLLQQVSAGR